MSVAESITTTPLTGIGRQWAGPIPERSVATERPDAAAPEGDDQASFLRAMVRRLGGDGDAPEAGTHEGLVGVAARRLVSDAFLEPLLREARESSQPGGIFAPGAGEKRFGHLVDRAMADRIVDAHRFDVVEAVERSLLQRVTGEKSSEPITRLESGLTA